MTTTTSTFPYHGTAYQLHITVSYQNGVHILETEKNLTEEVSRLLFSEDALILDVLGKVARIGKLDEQVQLIVDLQMRRGDGRERERN